MRTLYWFQRDLRLEDNPALAHLSQSDTVLFVYLWQEPRPWCNLKGLGAQRERVLLEGLASLRDALAQRGQDLLVLRGSPELVIPDVVRDYRIDAVHTSEVPGWYEQRAIEVLRRKLAQPLTVHEGNTLFHRASVAALFEARGLPASFTPFRKQVEAALEPSAPVPAPDHLPPPPAVRFHGVPTPRVKPHVALPLRGDREAGRRRLRQFIDHERRIDRYKQTRNCLDPLDGSSTLSPWLASGALSPREVARAIADHEARHGGNESTYWLYFELLWREYFHWRALDEGRALFRHGGARGAVSNCTFEPRNFARWCSGDTDFPLVNALMHQLVATGWMSNRGRQLAASCLIHEYGIDWRYGAAFFEKHLIDYDVASNYGNWRYIAGVGADPRGGRHFNLAKQAALYDPEGAFTTKWDGHRAAQPRYVTDAADWPMTPEQARRHLPGQGDD